MGEAYEKKCDKCGQRPLFRTAGGNFSGTFDPDSGRQKRLHRKPPGYPPLYGRGDTDRRAAGDCHRQGKEPEYRKNDAAAGGDPGRASGRGNGLRP